MLENGDGRKRQARRSFKICLYYIFGGRIEERTTNNLTIYASKVGLYRCTADGLREIVTLPDLSASGS